MQRIDEPDQLWRVLDDLGDQQSRYLLEQLVSGDFFHADSIVSGGEVKFQAVHQCGCPPLESAHEGGVFTAQTVGGDRRDAS